RPAGLRWFEVAGRRLIRDRAQRRIGIPIGRGTVIRSGQICELGKGKRGVDGEGNADNRGGDRCGRRGYRQVGLVSSWLQSCRPPALQPDIYFGWSQPR